MADTYRLGVDVGGTFTDLLLINARTSAIAAKAKVPSTPKDPSIGVQVRNAAAANATFGVPPSDTDTSLR